VCGIHERVIEPKRRPGSSRLARRLQIRSVKPWHKLSTATFDVVIQICRHIVFAQAMRSSTIKWDTDKHSIPQILHRSQGAATRVKAHTVLGRRRSAKSLPSVINAAVLALYYGWAFFLIIDWILGCCFLSAYPNDPVVSIDS
jgi:hypothetical protein